LEASFGPEGGTLGRTSKERENHLALPDPERYISRKHAAIKFDNGFYYLTDTSVDGTYIQNKNIRVCQDTVVLADGDRLRIGDYELIIHIPALDAPDSAAYSSASSRVKDTPVYSGTDRDSNEQSKLPGEPSRHGKDHTLWPGSYCQNEGVRQGHAEGEADASALHEAFTPPDIAGDPNQSRELPENFNFENLISDLDGSDHDAATSESFFKPKDGIAIEQRAPAYDEVAKADPVAIEKMCQQVRIELLQAFLEAAGVKDTRFLHHADIPGFMQTLGTVFREMVIGLTAILHGRSELKNQLRVPATTLKPVDNNPLKFSRMADEALKQILTGEQSGFMDARAAVREGFTDIMNHQMAMTSALQTAVMKLLERFDPHHFAKRNDEGVIFKKKAKYWDAYRQSYTEIANQALEDFFGEHFARAYEDQLRKLQSKTANSRSGQGVADADE
jgi:type VI secretion system FHA domain protein